MAYLSQNTVTPHHSPAVAAALTRSHRPQPTSDTRRKSASPRSNTGLEYSAQRYARRSIEHVNDKVSSSVDVRLVKQHLTLATLCAGSIPR